MSLYNKMRPTRLSEVRGQENIIKILKENLAPGGHLPNAMLFVGTRGTGKTTVARIAAKQLNCESPLADGSCCNECPACRGIMDGNYIDVLELDAASNNGVDNIRNIIEKVQFKPVGKKIVIIFDEVHMLSKAAFNALLKIMEEPPADVLFILCTTELHEIPATILSRCRKFQFNTITADVIIEKLKEINRVYGITAEESALSVVARAAKGSMRDAESIYENFLDVEGVITEKMVLETLGYASDELVFSVLDGITKGDPTISFSAIQQTIANGGSLSRLLEECFRILMDVVTIHMGGDISEFSSDSDYVNRLTEIAFSLETERLFEIADAFKSAFEKKGSNMELVFQSTVIGLVCKQGVITELVKKVHALENEIEQLKKGVVCNIPADIEELSESGCMVHAAEMPVEPVSVTDSGETFESETSVPDVDLSELAAMGFSVIESGDIPFAETPVAGPTDTVTSEDVAPTPEIKKEEAEDYFGDFARLFNF